MMMNCFCGMVDRRKAFSLISRRDHCKRSSLSRISNTPQAGLEPAQNLSSRLVEWSCAVVITTTPRRHGKNEREIDSLVKTVWQCSKDINTEFGILKWTLVSLERGKKTRWEEIQLSTEENRWSRSSKRQISRF